MANDEDKKYADSTKSPTPIVGELETIIQVAKQLGKNNSCATKIADHMKDFYVR